MAKNQKLLDEDDPSVTLCLDFKIFKRFLFVCFIKYTVTRQNRMSFTSVPNLGEGGRGRRATH